MLDENPESWGQRIMAWWASVHELVERDEAGKEAAA